MQGQVLVIQEWWMSQCFSTVTQRRRKDTTRTARGLHDEVQRNPDGHEAEFSTVQDREQEAEMSSTVKVGATRVSPCRRTQR